MGLEGIDLNLCGAPGFRESPDMHLAIGFKTVLHSPGAEELFLRSLAKANLSSSLDIPSIAIVELGTAWGSRGKRQAITEMSLPTLTLKEEIRYYVHWVHAVAFPHRLVFWISSCGCSQGGIADKRELIRDMWSEVQSHYKDSAVFNRQVCFLALSETCFFSSQQLPRLFLHLQWPFVSDFRSFNSFLFKL